MDKELLYMILKGYHKDYVYYLDLDYGELNRAKWDFEWKCLPGEAVPLLSPKQSPWSNRARLGFQIGCRVLRLGASLESSEKRRGTILWHLWIASRLE